MDMTPELELREGPEGWGLYLHGKYLSEGLLVEAEIEDGQWIEGH